MRATTARRSARLGRARADVPARPSTALQPEPERGSTTLQPEAERNRKAMKSCETAESSCEGAEYVNETSAEQSELKVPLPAEKADFLFFF